MFSKKRTLILTTLPRLLYADPDAKKLKGEIPWLPDKPVIFKSLSGNGFDIVSSSSGRSYHFQDAENKKEKWQELLADGIKRLSIV